MKQARLHVCRWEQVHKRKRLYGCEDTFCFVYVILLLLITLQGNYAVHYPNYAGETTKIEL